jgi:RNA polymerase sigma-70 factor, ECF subfamily
MFAPEMNARPPVDPQLQGLLNQIAAGCHQSAQQLYGQHHRALYAFIRLRVGNDEAAEEIVNDTFMVAFRKPHKFDGSCEYRTWLIGIAKRLCSNWLRKHGPARRIETNALDEELLDTVPAEALTALEQLEDQEQQAALQICIDKLPERQREALYWHWHQELKLADIAANMACSEGTIKTQLHHARNKIMHCLRQAFGMEAAYA